VAVKPSAMRGNTSLAWPMFEHTWLGEEGALDGEVVDRNFLYVAFTKKGQRWIGDFRGAEVLWRGPQNEAPYYDDEIEAGAVKDRSQVPIMFKVMHPGLIHATARATAQMVDAGEFNDGTVKIDESKAEALICPPGSIVARTGTFMSCWEMFGLDSESDKTSSNAVDARAKALSDVRDPGADDPVFQVMINAGFPGDPSSDQGRKERLQVIEDARRELVMTGLTKYNNQVWIPQPDGGRVKIYVMALVGKTMSAGKGEVADLFDAALVIKSEQLQADHASDVAFQAMRSARWSGDPSSSDGRKVRKALLREARAIAIKLALGKGEFLFSVRGSGVPERYQALTVLGLEDDADADTILAKLELMLGVSFDQLDRGHDTGYKAVRRGGWAGRVHPGIMGFRATVLIKAARCLVDSEQVDQLVDRIQEARAEAEAESAAEEGSEEPAPRKRSRRRPRRPRKPAAEAPDSSGAETEAKPSEPAPAAEKEAEASSEQPADQA